MFFQVIGVQFHQARQQIITAQVLSLGQLAAADIVMFAILRGLNGLCVGAMVPSSNTIITYLIPEAKRGAAYGVTSGASLMGNVLGPISAGLLARFFGLSAIFWLTSALFAAVAFLPPTLIGTIYGMNFEYMPELDDRWGYPVALALMWVVRRTLGQALGFETKNLDGYCGCVDFGEGEDAFVARQFYADISGGRGMRRGEGCKGG